MNTQITPAASAGALQRSRGLLTVIGAVIGLALGPSVIALLSFGVFIRPIEMEFGWSRVQVSLAASIIAYMVMAVSPLQGILVDRFGPRRVILWSVPAFSAGLASFYFLPNHLPVFYLMWALIPVLGIGLWPLAYLKLVSCWFDRRLGFALGITNGGIGIGTIVVPLLASLLVAAIGWRTTFAALGGLVLLVTWPAVFFLTRDTSLMPDTRAASSAPPGMSYAETARTREFRVLIVVFFIFGLTLNGLITQQVPLLLDAGWTPQRAALVQSIFGMALFAGRIGVGYIIDRVFVPLVIMCIAVGAALACILYATVPAAAFISAALLGLAVGAEFDILAFLIKRYFGVRAFGKIYGTVFAAFQFASGISQAVIPLGRQMFGSYTFTLIGAAVALILSAYLPRLLGAYRYTAEGARHA